MQKTLTSLENSLVPVDTLVFTWLTRIMLAGTLAGVAWIDDAPPLELAALIVTLYVVIRILMQAGTLFAAIPFSSKALKAGAILIVLGALGLSFPTMYIFVFVLAEAALG